MTLPLKHPTRELPIVFKALSDMTRLRLLNLMSESEACVCYFCEVLKLAQPMVSRHLAYLKKAGLVETRRDGQWIYYRWAEHSNALVRATMDGLCDWMSKDDALARERRKLAQIRCS